MANLAVLASGNGSNFQSIAERFATQYRHRLSCLIYDRRNAFAAVRAEKLGVPSHYVSYFKRPREEAEEEIGLYLARYEIDLIALAGYMRLFTPGFVGKQQGRILNIHPSLLPKYPGTRGIEESYCSPDRELGITIHYVDAGIDTGSIIVQPSFHRNGTESLDEISERIHALEHDTYPDVILKLLNQL